MWHSLDENGKIEIYDVQWSDGTVETNIPVGLLESVREGAHTEGEEHGVQEKDTPVNERIYKRRTMKVTRRMLRQIIREACDLATGELEAAGHTPPYEDAPTADVPVPADYEATRSFMETNPEIVDLGLSMVMDAAGTSCERSTAQGIIDHLQGMLGAPEKKQAVPALDLLSVGKALGDM